MTNADNSDEALQEFVMPIWLNAHWAKNCIDLYDGISKHAPAINKTPYDNFFGLTQQLALDGAVITLCKLYDTGSQRFEKHTIPDLFNIFLVEFSQSHASRLRKEYLLKLGFEDQEALALISKASNPAAYEEVRYCLMRVLKEKMPSRSTNLALRQLFIYRNKVGAHQEQLSVADREAFRWLPPLDEMEKLVLWAATLCKLVTSVLGNNIVFVDSCISARMAALNLAAKVLDKKFDDPKNYKEYEEFCKR